MQPGPAAPRLQVPAGPNLPAGDFTLEAYVLLRSVYEDGTVRPIAAHWGGDRKKPGWVVGVTGRKSAFKPQSLVLQLWGQNAAGQADYEAIFSGLHVELNKPYYVAVTVKLADPGKAGVTFHLKDLSHDDEPMQTAQAAHTVVKMEGERGPLYLGGGEPKRGPAWDGLLDDVRLSRAALPVEQLLVNRDGTTPQTAGYWMFEMQPGELKDVSGHGLDLVPVVKGPAGGAGAQTGALADLCQVLLNANEFLYVD
jgi:hypothetical protein